MEKPILECIFNGKKKIYPCQWRHVINDKGMCWRNCAGCMFVEALKKWNAEHEAK